MAVLAVRVCSRCGEPRLIADNRCVYCMNQHAASIDAWFNRTLHPISRPTVDDLFESGTGHPTHPVPGSPKDTR